MVESIWQALGTTTSTRLLKLHPSSGDSSGSIHATLLEADLSDEPKYEAISWTWGIAADERSIHVNGVKMLIREQLWRFLTRLRSVADRVLWVDAICINQQDNVEKSRQVAIIGDIFRSAEIVVAWLGEHADGSEGIFERLASKASTTLTNGKQIDQPINNFEQEARTRAWLSFLDRPWFTRTWIVQEASLARQLVLHCGDSVLDWNTLPKENGGSFDGIIQHYGRTQRFFSRKDNRDNWLHRLQLQRAVYHGKQYEGMVLRHYFTVENIATSFSRFQCSDVRDKVYAFLSLEKMEHLPHGFSVLKPDYALDTGEMLVYLFRQRYKCLWRNGPMKNNGRRSAGHVAGFASKLGELLKLGQGRDIAQLLQKNIHEDDDKDIWMTAVQELRSLQYNDDLFETNSETMGSKDWDELFDTDGSVT